MAGYYPPEIMLLQVSLCQSSAGSRAVSQTKGGSGSTQRLMANYPRMGMAWPDSPLCPSSPFQSNRIIATCVFYPDCTKRHLFVRLSLNCDLEKYLHVR